MPLSVCRLYPKPQTKIFSWHLRRRPQRWHFHAAGFNRSLSRQGWVFSRFRISCCQAPLWQFANAASKSKNQMKFRLRCNLSWYSFINLRTFVQSVERSAKIVRPFELTLCRLEDCIDSFGVQMVHYIQFSDCIKGLRSYAVIIS